MIIDLVLCSGTTTTITTAAIQIMVCSHCLILKATLECHFMKNMQDSSGYWWHHQDHIPTITRLSNNNSNNNNSQWICSSKDFLQQRQLVTSHGI
jgi:hypothetical protein